MAHHMIINSSDEIFSYNVKLDSSVASQLCILWILYVIRMNDLTVTLLCLGKST